MRDLRALAEQVAGAAQRIEQKLDSDLAEIAELRLKLADRDSLVAVARADLAETGDSWPFEVPDPRQ